MTYITLWPEVIACMVVAVTILLVAVAVILVLLVGNKMLVVYL